ncbi:hypothetical protein [Streptomyces neyagawaensis]|uniref:Uncharacterized protein n=1 Tax=Streptomyces neyagawaensis TaxID=42238 RepID=A0ABV3AZ92_9ACTN
MTVRTYVSTTVRNDHVDDVLHALEDLDPNAILAAVNRSDDPDVPAGVSASLTGDVREAVEKHLAAIPELEFRIQVRDTEEP